MFSVRAHAPGSLPTAIETLDAPAQEALVAHFVSGSETVWTQEFLRHLWARRLWLACACRSSKECPPLLFVRHLPPARFALARMADRPPHRSGCPFAQSPTLDVAADAAQAPVHALQALLLRWLSAAKLNVIYPAEPADRLHGQFEALREAARNLQIEFGRRLYDFSRTHADGLPALADRLKRNPGARGLFLTRVEALVERTLRERLCVAVNAPSAFADGSLQCVTPRPSCLEGPFVALFEFIARPTRGWSVHVAAQPVFDHDYLLPVDGTHERRTLQALLELQQGVLRARGTILVIRKTLPGTAVHERGISYQVERLGANGRSVRTVEVVSLHDVERVEAGSGEEGSAHYHLTGRDHSVQARADQVLKKTLEAQLFKDLAVDSVTPRARPESTRGSALASA